MLHVVIPEHVMASFNVSAAMELFFYSDLTIHDSDFIVEADRAEEVQPQSDRSYSAQM